MQSLFHPDYKNHESSLNFKYRLITCIVVIYYAITRSICRSRTNSSLGTLNFALILLDTVKGINLSIHFMPGIFILSREALFPDLRLKAYLYPSRSLGFSPLLDRFLDVIKTVIISIY